MKKRFLIPCAIGVAVVSAVACKNPTEVRGVSTLSVRDTTLLVDERLTVPVVAREADGDSIANAIVTFSSSTPAVVSVSEAGVATALSQGTSVLTARANGKVATATITVRAQFTRLATGEGHACGITGREELYCWGMALYGELGVDPESALPDCSARLGLGARCSAVPVRSANFRAVSIVAGDMHTCALNAAGIAYCWGANFYGQLGTGSMFPATFPTPVAGGHVFTQLVAGRMHTCGITTAGDAYCWGWDWTGALGAGDVSTQRCQFFSSDPCSRTPRLVVGQHRWTQLTASTRTTCGLTTTGQLYCWGIDAGGSDGLYCQEPTDLTGCTRTPVLIGSSVYKNASIGDVHRCQLTNDGKLECWGGNYWGMFGNGTTNSFDTPVVAAGGSLYTSFVSHRLGTCALAADKHAQCWGYGTEGANGNGSTQHALSPVDVSGGHRFTELTSSGSSDFVCGLTDTGRAYCWGWGVYGQLGNNAFLSANTPVLVRLVSTN